MPARPPSDRRIAKTRLALRDAMLELLPEHGWDGLNIQQICERANVGRSTFYMHYRGKDDLLDESLDGLRAALGHAAATDQPPRPPLAFMHGLLTHVVEHRGIFRAVVGRRSGHGVERRFRDMVLRLVEQDQVVSGLSGVRRQVVARYLAGAVMEVMAWWVDAADAPPLELVQRLIHELTGTALSAPLAAPAPPGRGGGASG